MINFNEIKFVSHFFCCWFQYGWENLFNLHVNCFSPCMCAYFFQLLLCERWCYYCCWMFCCRYVYYLLLRELLFKQKKCDPYMNFGAHNCVTSIRVKVTTKMLLRVPIYILPFYFPNQNCIHSWNCFIFV